MFNVLGQNIHRLSGELATLLRSDLIHGRIPVDTNLHATDLLPCALFTYPDASGTRYDVDKLADQLPSPWF